MNKFFNWIKEQGGPVQAARKIGAESPRVKAWIDGKAYPNAKSVQALLVESRKTKSPFTLDDIIRDIDLVKEARAKRRNLKA